MAKGRLVKVGASAVDPDSGALRQQIESLNPNALADEIEKQAREITRQLEGSTPKFPTWQDWSWPLIVEIIANSSNWRDKMTSMSWQKIGTARELFGNSLYGGLKEITDVEGVWSSLKPDAVNGLYDNWSPMAYIFKCRNCGAILTIWDSD